ncbi:hypothetical protein BDK51DRAFT_42952 [Blyttiomyces helicus]|uniref:Uncharacterized protein n=1 Tax=Blyttiomyces helicus TaxID=388810 RepID=A0A4P9WJ99_9FUNG|nr:hypothetical protein BDK51DRAFT_42952 [Blyttiomyces helicus]|eukprot:RKO92991.1 hypothetical protein BDK51DRAFT_42952 [Blyttiomyces helicus]
MGTPTDSLTAAKAQPYPPGGGGGQRGGSFLGGLSVWRKLQPPGGWWMDDGSVELEMPAAARRLGAVGLISNIPVRLEKKKELKTSLLPKLPAMLRNIPSRAAQLRDANAEKENQPILSYKTPARPAFAANDRIALLKSVNVNTPVLFSKGEGSYSRAGAEGGMDRCGVKRKSELGRELSERKLIAPAPAAKTGLTVRHRNLPIGKDDATPKTAAHPKTIARPPLTVKKNANILQAPAPQTASRSARRSGTRTKPAASAAPTADVKPKEKIAVRGAREEVVDAGVVEIEYMPPRAVVLPFMPPVTPDIIELTRPRPFDRVDPVIWAAFCDDSPVEFVELPTVRAGVERLSDPFTNEFVMPLPSEFDFEPIMFDEIQFAI